MGVFLVSLVGNRLEQSFTPCIPAVEYGRVEWQAYEFAGRLLVPSDALQEAFPVAVQSAQAAVFRLVGCRRSAAY